MIKHPLTFYIIILIINPANKCILKTMFNKKVGVILIKKKKKKVIVMLSNTITTTSNHLMSIGYITTKVRIRI